MSNICRVYRSEKKSGAYLYLALGKKMDSLPEALLSQLGGLSEVMLLDLSKRKHLANADINKVSSMLSEQGFYLQLPPGPEKYLRSE